ncbi:MAG: DUF262 domain-containing protein, partial [Dehalococcoidales bacterium]|nr:DUF262 domain-containing protein [Dehalococcoidales bacterium]
MFHYVEKALEDFEKADGLELIPDFQRGHVWTREQQERWIEAVIRGAISSAGLTLQFNAPNWNQLDNKEKGDLPPQITCIDGLQRLTAIRLFVAGKINAFGLTVDKFAGTSYDIRRYRFKVAIHEFKNRAEVLDYYLDLNAGGTPHPAE